MISPLGSTWGEGRMVMGTCGDIGKYRCIVYCMYRTTVLNIILL